MNNPEEQETKKMSHTNNTKKPGVRTTTHCHATAV